MLTKVDVSNLVNAMPESSFERVEGVELIQAPTKFDKGFGMAVSVICLVPLAVVGVSMLAGMAAEMTKTFKQMWQERKARKAAEAAAKLS